MVVGVLSNRVDREDVTAGDHIYSWRTAYLYAHHGIYVGDGMVIHFTRATGHEIRTGTFLDRFRFSSSPATVEGPPCQKCGDLIKRQGVIMSCLDCFLDGGNLYLFEYAVSPAFFLAKARGGTCTMASSDTADVVIHRAQYLLNNGFGMYCLFKNNCEDFAIYCKTGLLVETAFSVGRSGQLASLTAAFNASPVRFLTTSAGGLAIVTSGMYCVGRYLSDIGVRRDVIKVPVERLGEHWVRHGNGTSVEMLLPKLLHADYFTEPRLEELAAKERAEPGYCCRVRDFVVGRHGYGSIKFLGETDVRGLDLESIVEFNNREVIVYKDDSKKPPVGEGLNKPAGVTLLNIKCVNKKTGEQYTEGPRVDRCKEMLVKKAEEQGAEFISFDAVKGEWKFRVKHFSSYGFW